MKAESTSNHYYSMFSLHTKYINVSYTDPLMGFILILTIIPSYHTPDSKTIRGTERSDGIRKKSAKKVFSRIS